VGKKGHFNRGAALSRASIIVDVPLDLRLDDVLRLRKPHPCGGYDWRVVRLGADIGLVCLTCGRRVMLTRREVEKRMRQVVQRGPEPPPTPEP
jgi:hypothetical protein